MLPAIAASAAASLGMEAWRSITGTSATQATSAPADSAATGQTVPVTDQNRPAHRNRLRAGGGTGEVSDLVQQALLQAQANGTGMASQVDAVMKSLDKDGDGKVSPDELRGAMDQLSARDSSSRGSQTVEGQRRHHQDRRGPEGQEGTQTANGAVPSAMAMMMAAYAARGGTPATAAGAGGLVV